MRIKLVVAAAMALALLAGSASGAEKKRNKSGLAAPEQSAQKIKGVIDVGPNMSPQEVTSKLVKGKTTLDEVMVLLGSPQHIAMLPNDGQMVMYSWRKELQDGGYTPPTTGEMITSSLPGPFALFSIRGSKKRVEEARAKMEAVRNSYRNLSLAFDSAGVLSRFQFSPPLPLSTTAVDVPAPTVTASTQPK